MLFEIRNYTVNPDRFEAMREWGKTEAFPYLSHHLDILGRWASTKDEPEISGEPLGKLGSANFTWIIRWRDFAHRNAVFPRVTSSPEWEDIFSHVPGGIVSYLRVEAKFAEPGAVGASTPSNSGSNLRLFEIRNYHFNPELFEAFKEWEKTEVAPYHAQHFDVLGSWLSTKDESEIYGEPLDKLGSANYTWITRWGDLAHRNTVWRRVWSSPEWKDILSHVPGGMSSFLRIEARFVESIA